MGNKIREETAVITFIIGLIILIILNVIFVYVPVRRIELRLDNINEQIEPELPKIGQIIDRIDCFLRENPGLGGKCI